MKLSLNWLSDFVSLPEGLSNKQLAYDLTMSTVEVEDMIDLGAAFKDIVLAKVLEVAQHPNAERLKVCQLDTGTGEASEVVCGAENVRAGILVALAKPGALVTGKGATEPTRLKASKIRGVTSNGMICAADEIGLAELFPHTGERGILELSNLEGVSAQLGAGLAECLGLADTIIEIDNKSLTNRPDLWGHYGVARELAAIYRQELKPLPRLELPAENSKLLSVRIDAGRECLRYQGVLLDGIENSQSPFWMQRRLSSVGQRPINLLVDLTNYVLFATGQPLHVFDRKKLSGSTIYVRNAAPGEQLALLDDTQIELGSNDIVIADERSPHALAGVMGGENSAADSDTTTVVLEIASFNGAMVRGAAGRHGKRTESSVRFEKCIDIARVDLAAEYYLHLLRQIQPNSGLLAASNVASEYANASEAGSRIKVSHDFIVSRIGQQIAQSDIKSILGSLGFAVEMTGSDFALTVPSWRATGDVSIKDDIVEEVARLYGYDNLVFSPPSVVLERAVLQPRVELEKEIKRILSFRLGMHEVFSYPWIESRYNEAAGLSQADELKLADPPAESQAAIQSSLIPNMLLGVKVNLRHIQRFSLYEVASVFRLADAKDLSQSAQKSGYTGVEARFNQPKMISGAVVENSFEEAFFGLKGALESLFAQLPLAGVEFLAAAEAPEWLAEGAAMVVRVAGSEIGHFGLVNKRTARLLGLERAGVALFEFCLDLLKPDPSLARTYQPLHQFPVVDFDLALLCDESCKWQSIEKVARGAHRYVQAVSFLEEYRGSQIPEGKKSISLKLTLLDPSATLTSEQIESSTKKVIARLGAELGVELRTQ
jgi:phenylalanyl-tRNA synthetase beta chain